MFCVQQINTCHKTETLYMLLTKYWENNHKFEFTGLSCKVGILIWTQVISDWEIDIAGPYVPSLSLVWGSLGKGKSGELGILWKRRGDKRQRSMVSWVLGILHSCQSTLARLVYNFQSTEPQSEVCLTSPQGLWASWENKPSSLGIFLDSSPDLTLTFVAVASCVTCMK